MNQSNHKENKKHSILVPCLAALSLGSIVFSFGRANFLQEVGDPVLGPKVDTKTFAKLEAACKARDVPTILKIIPPEVEHFIASEYLHTNKINPPSNGSQKLTFFDSINLVKIKLGSQGEGIKPRSVIIGCTQDYVRQHYKQAEIIDATAKAFAEADQAYENVVNNLTSNFK